MTEALHARIRPMANLPPSSAGRKILVVEDERDIAELIALHLSDLPAEVTLAADGPRGLELALRQPWDLIVLDIRLPGMSGLELCRKLRAKLSQVPILMIAARSGELDRVMGLELGADEPDQTLQRARIAGPGEGPAASLGVDRGAGGASIGREALDDRTRQLARG